MCRYTDRLANEEKAERQRAIYSIVNYIFSKSKQFETLFDHGNLLFAVYCVNRNFIKEFSRHIFQPYSKAKDYGDFPTGIQTLDFHTDFEEVLEEISWQTYTKDKESKFDGFTLSKWHKECIEGYLEFYYPPLIKPKKKKVRRKNGKK